MEVVLEQVVKQFQDKGRTVTAVNGLSVTIGSGKLVGFLGPSGCGKSTTLFMLAGIYETSGGRILFDGQDVSALPPEKRGVGMVFQNYALYPHLTVRDNIAFPLLNSKELKARIKEEATAAELAFKQYVEKRVQGAAELVEISDYLDRKPAELSGGQQQRVAIARALVKRPSLLLLDEPLSNLDARLRLQTREEIRRIQKETGITTVFVTHDQEEALNICDEIVIMKDGLFQQQGAPQTVYDQPANQFVASFLGAPPINLPDGEVRDGTLWLSGAPWRVLPQPLADGPVKIGLRAENLAVSAPDEADSLTATVSSVSKLGGAITVDVLLSDGQKLRLFHDPRHTLTPGDKVSLRAADGGICLFDGEGGKVLQW